MESKRISISPSALLWLLLGAWWGVNLIQAAFTELANDEAYYWMFAQDPDWGYFDHPPMTAWFVWLGSFLGGELGVRFFFTLLQPLYLYILYRIIRPAQGETLRDVTLFVVVSAALPVLQLYGFLAVPDGPLLLCSALFLWCYKRFTEKNTIANALWMGLAMAALAYAKYHGALVVLFALIAYPKIFKNPKLYLAAFVTVILLIPHLIWQADHDWASFRYHLAGRSGFFRINWVTEFLLNIFAIFNPFFFPLYVKSWIRTRSLNPTERAIRTITLGLIVFFLLSSVRGYVQPQWVIVSAFGFIMLLFRWARIHPRTRKYTIVTGFITIGLIAVARIIMIFNPFGVGFKLHAEVFENKTSYGQIAEAAQGRPVMFGGSYAIAAKYMFYTGQPAYSQPHINYRTSQWQFRDDDRRAAGNPVLIETGAEWGDTTLHLSNRRTFSYVTEDDFRPVREVEILATPLPYQVKAGESIEIALNIYNPYDYDIVLCADSQPVEIVWGRNKEAFREYPLAICDTLRARSVLRETVLFDVPPELADKRAYRVGFTIRPRSMGYWFNSREFNITVEPADPNNKL